MYDYSSLRVKIDEPLITRWSFNIMRNLLDIDQEDFDSFVNMYYDDLAVSRITELNDPDILHSLFGLLPART